MSEGLATTSGTPGPRPGGKVRGMTGEAGA
jgi:hypothetical protein